MSNILKEYKLYLNNINNLYELYEVVNKRGEIIETPLGAYNDLEEAKKAKQKIELHGLKQEVTDE